MSTPAANVRVRLSAEGVRDVVAALKTVEKQAKDTASARGLGALRNAFKDLKGLLPALGAGAAVAGFVSLARTALNNADAIGKLSQKTGATTEDISALAVAGRTADVSLETLQGALVKANVAVGDLKNGSESAQKAFAKLGLSAKDFAGLNVGQSYELIAKRLLAIEDASQLASVGADILGKNFADTLPLLRAVANEGLGGLREEAERLGLLISGDLAAAAESANDSFTLIKLQAEGIATAFISGLAPSIVATMSEFSSSLQGDGVKQIQLFGRETGRVLRTVAQTFKIFFTVVAGVFNGLGNQIAIWSATVGALTEGDFKGAARIWKEAGQNNTADFKGFVEKIKQQFNELVRVATTEAPPITLDVKAKDDELRRQVQAALDRANAAAASAKNKSEADKAKREAEKAERELQKLQEERQRAEEAAGKARVDLEQKLLEASGRTKDAKLAALDEEIAKYKEVFAAANGGQVSETDTASLAQYAFKREASINFEDLAAQGESALDELAATRERIQQDVELGITSQLQGQQQILAVEKDRVVVLEELAAALLQAAQASGQPELIAQAEEFARKVGAVRASVDNVSDGFRQLRQAGEDALQNGLEDVLNNLERFDSVGDVFKSLASTVVTALRQVASEILATYIKAQLLKGLGSLFGGGGGAAQGGLIGRARGGVVGYADGGAVDGTGGGLLQGPGTSTSDSIRAMSASGPVLLSNGEFIVRAAIVRRPGMLQALQSINAGAQALAAVPRGMPRRYADGGLMAEGQPAAAGQAGFAGVIGLEPGLVMKELESDSFDRLLVKKLQRNRTSLKSILA